MYLCYLTPCKKQQTSIAVRGKGHLNTCIAGRKDNLRHSILRKDNPKTTIEILFYHKNDCKEIETVSQEIRKVSKEIRKVG